MELTIENYHRSVLIFIEFLYQLIIGLLPDTVLNLWSDSMDEYEKKLDEYIKKNHVEAEQLIFHQSCHSVQEAADAASAKPSDFIKSIVLIGKETIVAIVNGIDRVDLKKVEKIIGEKLRMATPKEILERTGYPVGGTPCFGYKARFLLDEKVMKMEFLYGGGGSTKSLVKTTPSEIVRMTDAKIADISR